jgi:PAS domain S-box-containing protein
MISTLRDITRRKLAESRLRQSEARMIDAQSLAHFGNWESDFRTGALVWSDEVFRIYGVSPTDFVPTRVRFRKMVHPEDLDAVTAAVERACATGEPYHIDHRIVRPDGTEVYVREHARVEKDGDGNVIRMVGAVQDITEFKALEEQFRQAHKMEAIGLLAGGVAHDFNNMLAVIIGNADILAGELDPRSQQRERVLEIMKAAERNADLTRQLLAFSRRQMLRPQVIDLNESVAKTERMLRRVIGADIRLQTVLEEGLANIKVDPGQIEQIVMNLAVNSRDAMPQGGTLTIRTYSAGDASSVLEITDTGHGMDEATRKRVFEPFFTTKEFGKGSGLGLSSVYGIVEQSGGRIQVWSEPGKGTCFQMHFPSVREPKHDTKTAPAETAPRGAETILVVDDEPGVRTLIAKVLAGLGYNVLEAEDGQRGEALCAGHRVDLLVADVVMPRMNGKELAKRVMNKNPKVKVVYVSGHSEEAVLTHGSLEPGQAFLQKPFLPFELGLLVRQVLDA